MDSVNNPPDLQAKPPDFAASILSSLNAGLASGNPLDKLFSNLLSGVQTPAPPPNPTPDTSAAAASSTPPPQQSQSLQQTGSSAETGSAPQADNADNKDNNNAAAAVSPGTAAKPPAGSRLAGKFLRHEAKTHTGKGKPHNADDKSGRSSPSSAVATANNQPPAAGDPTVSDSKNAADTADLPIDPTADPVVGPASDPSTTPAGTGQNANPQNTPSTADASPASSDNAAGNGNTAANGGDVTMSELLLLLSQLEQFAARQLTGTPANPVTPLANAGATQSANSTPAASTGSADTKQALPDKSGLEGLLATLGRLDNLGTGNASGQNGSNQTNALPDTTQTPAATTASLQNTVSQASSAPASNTGNGWPAGFFDLFNSAFGNPANVPLPAPGLVPSANTLATSDGGDGLSLDMDMQGQNGAASRNAVANAATNNALTPLTIGAPPPASPYDFASQLSALRLAKGGDTGLPAPVEQVILQMGRGARDGSNQMTIQLRPAELGRVDVKLSISSDGKVQGTVTADNPTTLGLLLKDVRSLERALQEAGLRADSGSLQFNLRGDGQPGGGFGQTADQANTGSNQTNMATSLAIPADAGELYYLTPGGVNMRV